MRPRKIEINPGDKFGFLTVLCEKEKNKDGHRQYEVRCDCGKQYTVLRGFLLKDNPKCLECSRKYARENDKGNAVGQTINNWYVISETESTANGTRKFICRCNQCGSISIKSKGEMRRVKTNRCENCYPDYQFRYEGNTAIGMLSGGIEFMIDAEDVGQVSKMHWNYSKSKDYILSAERNLKRMPLHRYLLGVTNSSILVDHINRNRMDCRKSNLRIATPQQNSMNCGMRSNKTGYKGVSFIKAKNLYRAQIGINDRDISLGRSKDPVKCAQMYNLAARILFGDYCGFINDVPDADMALKKRIEKKLLPYLAEAEAATQSCGLFLCKKGA